MEYIKEVYPQILDEKGRINLKSEAITPELQAILEEAISASVAQVYSQSMEMDIQRTASAARRSA